MVSESFMHVGPRRRKHTAILPTPAESMVRVDTVLLVIVKYTRFLSAPDPSLWLDYVGCSFRNLQHRGRCWTLDCVGSLHRQAGKRSPQLLRSSESISVLTQVLMSCESKFNCYELVTPPPRCRPVPRMPKDKAASTIPTIKAVCAPRRPHPQEHPPAAKVSVLAVWNAVGVPYEIRLR